MKTLVVAVLFLLSVSLSAQEPEAEAVQKAIDTFFEGFHQQDSVKMKSTIGNEPILRTIGKNNDGIAMVRSESFDKLLKSIVSIPDSITFQEKIKSYNIQIDGDMANAWTPYEFWLNGELSHCGVNSFQLFKDREGWKIIYLIDTRRKEDCE